MLCAKQKDSQTEHKLASYWTHIHRLEVSENVFIFLKFQALNLCGVQKSCHSKFSPHVVSMRANHLISARSCV